MARRSTRRHGTTSARAGGFQGEVKVTAGATAIRGWTVNLVFPNGQTIGQSWGAEVTSEGSRVTARNVTYNGALASGASVTFGLLGNWLGSNAAPALNCTATR